MNSRLHKAKPTYVGSTGKLRAAAALVLGVLAALCALGPAWGQAPASAVLLYDSKVPEQVELAAAARKALAPHRAKAVLRDVDAALPTSAAFMRLNQLARDSAPVLLVMSSAQPQARVTRRIPLPASDPNANVRAMLAALKLPVPKLEPPKPGPLLAITADGGAAEKKALVNQAGNQRQAEGARILDAGGVLVYRIPVPEGLRAADLHAELGGDYLVEWSERRNGPWNVLMDSDAFFGPAADAVPGRAQPVVNLDTILLHLPGDLYLRIRTNGRGRNRASVARLEVVALGRNETSAEDAWTAEAERLRQKHLATLLPEGQKGTPLAGTLDGATTLDRSRSPYLLTGDLFIPPGAVLTVEPGVTIKVVGAQAIRVQGRLAAVGTAEQPITVAPAAPNQPDDWKGIRFVALPNRPMPRSTLAYCRIANALAGVELNAFTGEVSHCVFQDCLAGAVLKGEGEGRVHHSRFLRCRTGLVVSQGAGEITANEWVECDTALEVAELPARGRLQFEGNSLRDSRIAAVIYVKQPGRQVPPLSLPNNHWSGTAPERMVGGGASAAEVTFEPRLEKPPSGVGPGW